MTKRQKIKELAYIVQPNYDANDPIVVAVRGELIRRHIERETNFRVNWLREPEKK